MASLSDRRKKDQTPVKKRFAKEKTKAISDEEAQRPMRKHEACYEKLEIQYAEPRNGQLSSVAAGDRYDDLYDLAPVGYFTFDKKGAILSANLTGACLLGVERTRLIGNTFIPYINRGKDIKGEYLDIFNNHINNTLKTEKPQVCEIELKRRDGKVFFASLESILYDDETIRTAISDITKRKEAEEEIRGLNDELKAKNAELEVANEELGAFAVSLSHDLRAPLRSIVGFSKILLEDYADKLDERGRDYLGRVQGASARMDRLISDLLGLFRIIRRETEIISVDLSRIARDIAANLKSREPDRKVEFAIMENVSVRSDYNLLRVAMENLLDNAWKFTSETVNARIEFGIMEKPPLQFLSTHGRSRPGGQEGTIYYVRDNGIGIDVTYSDKLFQPFQRLHSEKEFPGTGIGLATVARIIKRLGGNIWAEGKPDEGATFYFTLR